ncbi:hypothetical protein [Pararobbsia alpina]|uniref:Uncharacterized protein n=1 Tax=Pararobbsia alpina TaxID=621374 RepID=A0A6S7AYK6_9BURK|nr:hypothetical protein [Pararobbsia alpina]CAB3782008.1 hypothetical protein LMG28138_01417 [Pararobbsia alpina]
MNTRYVLGLSVILLASAGIVSNASAQEKSYSEVNPISAQQPAQLKQQSESGTVASASGSSTTGQRGVVGKPGIGQSHPATPACVGPVSFCSLYFGG